MFAFSGHAGVSVLRQRRVRGCGTAEGLPSVPAVQDSPVLRRRVSAAGLDDRWAQGDVWHSRKQSHAESRLHFRGFRSLSVGRVGRRASIAGVETEVVTRGLASTARVHALRLGHRLVDANECVCVCKVD